MPLTAKESWKVLWIPQEHPSTVGQADKALSETKIPPTNLESTKDEENDDVKGDSSAPAPTTALQMRKASAYLDISVALTLISIVVAFAISSVSAEPPRMMSLTTLVL